MYGGPGFAGGHGEQLGGECLDLALDGGGFSSAWVAARIAVSCAVGLSCSIARRHGVVAVS